MKKNGKKTAVAVLIVLMLSVLLSRCQGKKKSDTAIQATRVQTRTAEKGTLEVTGTYIGTMAPHTSVDVTPLVSGTVMKVNVKVGDHVSEGDVLCRFDDKAADLQLQSAEDAVYTAEAGKESAQNQIDAARKQARTGVVSLEGQLRILRDQKKTQEDQLDELNGSIDTLRQGSEGAQESYLTAKTIYESAEALYLQYGYFLEKYPECTTTTGLIDASIPEVYTDTSSEPDFTSIEGSISEDEFVIEYPVIDPGEWDDGGSEKQQTAAQLLDNLNLIPLNVEYLTEFGISSLKEQMDLAEEASIRASTSYSQALSSISQLESGIRQLRTQIRVMEKNLDATEDAANTRSNTKVNDAQIRAAETGVESAQYQKDLYTVKSPIDGVVEAVNVKENQISGQGMPAFTISDKELMEVSFYVTEEVREFLKEGDEVHIEADGGDARGRISSISTAVDPQKGLFKIQAQITAPGDSSLLTNTSVSLSLVTNSVRNTILIPFDAVYYDNDQAYVFVVENDRAVRTDVTVGPYNIDSIAVLEGLSEEDEVITTWGAGLKDGAIVQVIEQDSDTRKK